MDQQSEKSPAELFRRYWRAARAAAYGVTGDWTLAEDAASEAFFEALQGLGSLRDPGSFGAWFRTIVVRKAQHHAVARNRFAELPANLPSSVEDPDQQLHFAQLAAAIQQAAARLPDHLRETIALIYFEGYDSAQAAEFLGIPAGTLRRRLHEGREQIRSMVSQRCEEAVSLATGDLFEAARELLRLRRPPPRELVLRLFGGADASAAISQIRAVLHPPFEHPALASIRKALPEFEEWHLDVGAAFQREQMLPPGFEDGVPGYWLRPSRGLISGGGRSLIEELRSHPEGLPRDLHLVDVLELTWMTKAPMDLRAVQEALQKLAADSQPDRTPSFETYAEPRYRSALQLRFEGNRAAIGGVLHCADAAHVRILLDAWSGAGNPPPMLAPGYHKGK